MSTAVLPVIHHRDLDTTLACAALAAAAGCAGVFLIEMNGRDWEIDGPAVEVKRRHPGLRVGTNRLTMHPVDAIGRDVELGLDATWIDNPGVNSRGVTRLATAITEAVTAAKGVRPEYRFFGSVAFKTQDEDDQPWAAARNAADLGWVVTTSGPATGVAPDPYKLEVMRMAIPGHPFAVASGVTPENAPLLAPHVDFILVATGISRDFHMFDADKLAALMAAVGATAQRNEG